MKYLVILALLIPALFTLALLWVGVMLGFVWAGCMCWRVFVGLVICCRYLETRIHKLRSLLP